MKKVVSFSGGCTSAYLCKLMKDLYGDAVAFVFMDTGMEHERTYEFIRNCDKAFGLNLVCLRRVIDPVLRKGGTYKVVSTSDLKYDLTLFHELIKKHGTPKFPVQMHCTRVLKQEAFSKYCDDTYGKGQYVTYLGIRADEPRRLKPKEGVVFLADLDDSEKRDILDWWSQQSFNLELPEQLGNCLFCIRKALLKLALATKNEPERAEEFIQLVNLPDVRVTGEIPPELMYTRKHSLRSIIATFADASAEEISDRMWSLKRLETGSCTESCEVFSEEG